MPPIMTIQKLLVNYKVFKYTYRDRMTFNFDMKINLMTIIINFLLLFFPNRKLQEISWMIFLTKISIILTEKMYNAN